MHTFEDKKLEEVLEYWNARPCNIRHSTQPVGSRAYFDEVERRKYFVEPHIPSFAEFPRWQGKKVLEVGCGIGTDTMNFARNGALVTAVDLSDASLAIAKERAEVYGLTDRITFYQANAEELSSTVPIEKYDLVYSFGVIHHTPHPERVIAQIAHYMNQDSIFRFMVYNRFSFKSLWILFTYGKAQFWKFDKLIAKYSEAQTGCPVTYSYTKTRVEGLLEGMDLQHCYYEHIFPYDIAAYKQYQYIKKWYFRILPQNIFRALERTAGWHLCAEAVLKA